MKMVNKYSLWSIISVVVLDQIWTKTAAHIMDQREQFYSKFNQYQKSQYITIVASAKMSIRKQSWLKGVWPKAITPKGSRGYQQVLTTYKQRNCKLTRTSGSICLRHGPLTSTSSHQPSRWPCHLERVSHGTMAKKTYPWGSGSWDQW
jgi:hypothetical protein